MPLFRGLKVPCLPPTNDAHWMTQCTSVSGISIPNLQQKRVQATTPHTARRTSQLGTDTASLIGFSVIMARDVHTPRILVCRSPVPQTFNFTLLLAQTSPAHSGPDRASFTVRTARPLSQALLLPLGIFIFENSSLDRPPLSGTAQRQPSPIGKGLPVAWTAQSRVPLTTTPQLQSIAPHAWCFSTSRPPEMTDGGRLER